VQRVGRLLIAGLPLEGSHCLFSSAYDRLCLRACCACVPVVPARVDRTLVCITEPLIGELNIGT
jgi:hypothetical protein